ncbi:hypothetical protein DV515_00019458, partial [Chloebia gouldiae]
MGNAQHLNRRRFHSYGIVVDCGSSGSRLFVYCWPRHNGNPKDLLDIQQMRDSSRRPVVMKIKP